MAQAQLDLILNAQKYQRQLVQTLGMTEKQAAREGMKMARADRKRAEEAAKAQQRAAKKAGSAWKEAFKAISVIAIAKMAQRAAAAVAGLTKEVIDLRNEFGDMSTRTGIAASTLKGLKFASEASGQEFTKLVNVLRKLPKRMADAQAGSKRIQNAFKALNVEVLDADNNFRSSQLVFEDILVQLDKIEDPTTKAARAVDLLGRQGADLVVAMGGSAAAFAEMTNFAERWGASVAPDAIAQAARMQVEFAAMDVIIEGTKDKLASFIIESGSLKNAAVVFVFWSEVVSETFKAAREEISAVIDEFKALRDAGSIEEFVEQVLSLGKRNVLSGPVAIGTGFKRAGENVREFGKNWDAMMAAISAGTTSGGGIETGADGVDKMSEAMKKAAQISESSRAAMMTAEQKLTEQYRKQANELGEIIALYGVESAAGQAANQALTDLAKSYYHQRSALREKDAEEERKRNEAARLEAKRTADEQIALARTVSDARVSLASTAADSLGSIAQSVAKDNEQSQRRAWAVDKAAGMASAALNTALAVSNAFADVPYPANIAAAIQAGIQGAAHFAAVAASPAPSFYRGGSIDTTYAQPSGQVIPMEIHPRERVRVERQGSTGGRPEILTVESWLDGRRVDQRIASRIRRGGATEAEITRRSGRMGHAFAYAGG